MTIDTQKLREALEKATPGPWTWKQVGTYSTPGVALFWPDTSKPGVHYRRLDSNGGMVEADANLMTAARNALPALLDHIDTLAAENARLRGALQEVAATHHHSASCGDYFAKIARAALSGESKCA